MIQVAELRGPVQSVCWVATSSAATHGGPSAGDLGDAPYEEFDDGTEMGRAARQSPIEMLVPQIVDKSVAALSKDGSTIRYRFSSVFGPTVRRRRRRRPPVGHSVVMRLSVCFVCFACVRANVRVSDVLRVVVILSFLNFFAPPSPCRLTCKTCLPASLRRSEWPWADTRPSCLCFS